jgi:hypothetical protein
LISYAPGRIDRVRAAAAVFDSDTGRVEFTGLWADA